MTGMTGNKFQDLQGFTNRDQAEAKVAAADPNADRYMQDWCCLNEKIL